MLYGPQVATLASLVTVWTLATTALVLRLVARRMTSTPFWIDDFTCIAAYLLGTTYNAWVLVWIRDGFGLRLDEITWLSRADAVSRARRDVYFCEAFSSLALGVSKLAILAFYWRHFSHARIRYAVLYLAFLSFCWLVARTTVGAIRCVPAVSFWETSAQGECLLDERKIVYGGSISHLILGSLILALPLLELRKLRLQFWPLLGVIAIYICGILTCLCAIGVMVIALRVPAAVEDSFEIKDAVLFLSVEVNLLIVTASLPLLQPILEFVRKHLHHSAGLRDSCTHAAASTPAPTTPFISAEQEPPSRRPRRFRLSLSLPTTLFDSKIWTRLSSAATSKVNTGTDRSARTVGNKTVMTVSHDQFTRGVHVQLHREFRFVSPPGPEPIFVRPRRTDSSPEPGTAEDASRGEEEASAIYEGDVVDRMEKGEGKAVEQISNMIHPNTGDGATRRGHPEDQIDKGKAIHESNEPGHLDSEGAVSSRTEIIVESKEPEDASTNPIVKSMEQMPEKVENDTQ
ncbi:hypothetical protein N0V93_006445 [Gnomoniopsis smithogilvyi]|uniref:Rhodopsin domain-containing protein n=1 Tax=Gnomoniopsis smithogilvyi TaxID=1191159 RepID=A0A9W9CUH6_9PEZI|nr:hypothetical protein N0V93_006445 [Gnomoniopsis smithogilvyi]